MNEVGTGTVENSFDSSMPFVDNVSSIPLGIHLGQIFPSDFVNPFLCGLLLLAVSLDNNSYAVGPFVGTCAGSQHGIWVCKK